uniref:Uncharacterized protein MANES_04G159600 n=1 Tax=Rhizophora mucronata TaxID=61149 RepID=A0A2P2PJI7_RHIMU
MVPQHFRLGRARRGTRISDQGKWYIAELWMETLSSLTGRLQPTSTLCKRCQCMSMRITL